tara:strand:+ start:79950 stop:80912 length:963 start_codon:yes stop_codon:yes gene_type:complete
MGRPRIICYHGFNILDESSFIPGTFINQNTFVNRINLLKSMGAHFIKLDEVFNEQLPELPVILTFDDGFVSTLTEGLPILEQFDLPATLYVTTYYQQKQNPIFRLHLQYLLWKSSEANVNWQKFSMNLPFSGEENLKGSQKVWKVIEHFETKESEETREKFLREFEKQIGVALNSEQRKKSFTIASDNELAVAQSSNFDLQLHTHRHRLPTEKDECQKEILENREILKNFTHSSLEHFCYPSGIYDTRQFPWLEEVGVKTATTLLPGIVKKSSHPLELPRVLDSEAISNIQFEAEICGVGDLLRKIKGLFIKQAQEHSLT